VQVRALPSEIRGDAAGEIAASNWDEAREPYAARVLAKLERYAPGLGALILGRQVYSPLDLERANPNLVGGDSLAGSHHLRQNFLWRPFPNWSRYRMPLGNLYMVGAATWPGAGTHGVSGYLAAQQMIGPGRLLRRLARGAAVAGGAALATTGAAYWLAKQLRDEDGNGKES
jgi:phytoene dehydrogenase-like protein